MFVLPILPNGSKVLKRDVVLLGLSRARRLLFNNDWFDPELFDMFAVNSRLLCFTGGYGAGAWFYWTNC